MHPEVERTFVWVDGEFTVLVSLHGPSLRYVTITYNTIR